ncbi:glycosyl hydrolase family 28 protein [Hymenobacter sp. GOD-10R]|uniref:glycosyl hydrolase family 28 protein n=1 Tax=Hymenobacter sp. GOD-10R TaxID=3093922 RepID=UPI002D79BC3D|nr:glycosyl hydrolase family 28 protein [Hymenobacter sp. GOD-10R]WRQ31880.1 glycosyl hydrolase family 28 protein [Hymenobacter sp. GOD-10R]
MPRGFLLLNFLFLLAATAFAQPSLVIHPVPNGVLYSQHNDDYTVRVRSMGGEWKDLFEYNVQVDLDKVRDASMVTFDFRGAVEVAVRKNNGAVQQVRIRPLSYAIKPRLGGNTVYFTLDKPRKLSVEFNGDKLQNLHVFANALETETPDPKDPHVMYFGPGIHTPPDLPGSVIHVPSNTTVYLAGGAVLRAKLVVDHAENVRIIGRGILDQPERGVEVTFSRNVTIEGIIVKNPQHYTVYGGQSNHLTIRNLKSFSAKPWSDGIDLMSCSDVLVDDVFLRTSDDCVALYGHRWQFYGNARNVTVQNSILWADVAHPTNLGLHGDTNIAGDTIEHITFRNLDILEHDEDDPNYQGCLAISCGDLNLVRDVRYEDIRIEDFEEGQLLNLRVLNNPKYNTGPGRHIEQVVFKNISYSGALANPSVLQGLNAAGQVRNVRFENMRVNGKQVLDAAAGNLQVGEFTQDIIFKR